MAPLHAWKGAVAPGTVGTLPQTVSVIFLFIAKMLNEGTIVPPGGAPSREAVRHFALTP